MLQTACQPSTLPMTFSMTANVVCLDEVLSSYQSPFRAAIREALAWEDFEFTQGIPNLQLAREILVSIGCQSDFGDTQAWNSFRRFLEWADRQGVLVNLDHRPGAYSVH
ncbi:MAG TPA: hypothetical protein PKL14_09960 [Holophaga sp.]|jgi:hypothetical protein|nr:hypothetical protein [Holophaga sp.]